MLNKRVSLQMNSTQIKPIVHCLEKRQAVLPFFRLILQIKILTSSLGNLHVKPFYTLLISACILVTGIECAVQSQMQTVSIHFMANYIPR